MPEYGAVTSAGDRPFRSLGHGGVCSGDGDCDRVTPVAKPGLAVRKSAARRIAAYLIETP